MDHYQEYNKIHNSTKTVCELYIRDKFHQQGEDFFYIDTRLSYDYSKTHVQNRDYIGEQCARNQL